MKLSYLFKRILEILRYNKMENYEETKQLEKQDKFIKTLQTDVDIYNLSPNSMSLNLVEEKSKVLSIGCGAGREIKFLVQNKKCDVTAMDISKNMIDLSKKVEPSADYINQDAVDYISEKKFDFIVCIWNTINYFPSKIERKRFIQNSYKNLKKDGKLIITTGHRFSSIRCFLISLLSNKDYYYSPFQIKYWFKESKFKVIRQNIGNMILLIAIKKD